MLWDDDLPAGLQWLRGTPGGRTWLERLPGEVDRCAERWSLHLGRPYDGSHVSLAVPATTADGTEVVLKIQVPDRESALEAEALRRWAGDGAVRLLDHGPAHHALLLERCSPGSPLTAAGPEVALDVFVGLLPRLWQPAGPPFRSLSEEATGWADGLPVRWERAGRPFEQRLLDAAVDALRSLSSTQGEQVLLHQDLHAGNVLRAGREPWLAIDPKPLVGERGLGLAPIIRGAELGHGRRPVLGRLDRLTAELGLDRDRARGWAIGQTVAWAIDGAGVHPGHLDVARWLLDG